MKTTPFSYLNETVRRFATATEYQQGFACGPADQALFNGLFFRLESEIGHVIDYAGLIGTDTDLTQLRQAIQQLILSGIAAIEDTAGTIDTSQFILIGQARARLPIFPEIQTAGGVMGVTSPAPGTVRVPAGVTFQHRGIFPINTIQTDLATVASKTYHLRWNPTDGFTLKDLADVAYNPTVAAESSVAFDSTYDDMLVARVVTNGSNIATVTNLSNLNALFVQQIINGENRRGSGVGKIYDFVHTYNWSRTPKSWSLARLKMEIETSSTDDDFNIVPSSVADGSVQSNGGGFDVTRYRISQKILQDRSEALKMHFSGHA